MSTRLMPTVGTGDGRRRAIAKPNRIGTQPTPAAPLASAIYEGIGACIAGMRRTRMRSATAWPCCISISPNSTASSPGAGCGRSIVATSPNSVAATSSAIRQCRSIEAVRARVAEAIGRAPRRSDPPADASALLRPQLQSGQLLLLLRSRRHARSTWSSPKSPTRRGSSATPMCCRSPTPSGTRRRCAWHFDKRFHVSPFMADGARLRVAPDCHRGKRCACTWT